MLPPTRRHGPPSWFLGARLAVPPLVIGLAGTAPAAHGQPDVPRALDVFAFLLVALGAGAVALHRRSPWAAAAGNAAAVGTYLALGYAFGPVLLSTLVLAFALALRLPRVTAAVLVGGEAVLLGLATVVRVVGSAHGEGWGRLLVTWLVWAAVLAGVFAIGSAARVRREAFAGVRAAQARRAASEEQLRMAQELHDVVGHGLAVISLQAGVALHVLDRDVDKARESLLAIRSLSGEALDGLRTELARLRADDSPDVSRRPAPGLADLDVLVGRIRAGGVDVRLAARDLGDVPAEVGTTAYRIVQESLTNVLRHAETEDATVQVDRRDDVLVVTVEDSGSGVTTVREGSGIRGMRDRAQAVGGTLVAQPGDRRGWVVRAELPLPGHRA